MEKVQKQGMRCKNSKDYPPCMVGSLLVFFQFHACLDTYCRFIPILEINFWGNYPSLGSVLSLGVLVNQLSNKREHVYFDGDEHMVMETNSFPTGDEQLN